MKCQVCSKEMLKATKHFEKFQEGVHREENGVKYYVCKHCGTIKVLWGDL